MKTEPPPQAKKRTRKMKVMRKRKVETRKKQPQRLVGLPRLRKRQKERWCRRRMTWRRSRGTMNKKRENYRLGMFDLGKPRWDK